MAGAGVIGMAMGDHGALDGPDRIDMKAAWLAAQAGGYGHQDVLRTHLVYIVRLGVMLTVMRGLDPRIHLPEQSLFDGLPGRSPAMTM
jgi:hypothetical protein